MGFIDLRRLFSTVLDLLFMWMTRIGRRWPPKAKETLVKKPDLPWESLSKGYFLVLAIFQNLASMQHCK